MPPHQEDWIFSHKKNEEGHFNVRNELMEVHVWYLHGQQDEAQVS